MKKKTATPHPLAALPILRRARQLQVAGGCIRTHPQGVETMVDAAQYEGPDELGGICSEGGAAVRATKTANRSRVLTWAATVMRLRLVSCRFLVRRGHY